RGVAIDAVRSIRQGRRLTETGKVGSDEADARQLRDDRFQTVMLTPVAVGDDHGGFGIRWSVDPITRGRSENVYLVRRDGNGAQLAGEGGLYVHHLPV